MKVCILSMQRVGNFGSLLQSYALKKLLEQCGHSVSFLDIERNDADDQMRQGKALSSAVREHGFVHKLKKLDRYALNRLTIKKLAQKQDTGFEHFRRRMLGMEGNANNSRYDCCVIGSDEVFNCMSESPWGFTSQLFGNVKQARGVITYAASCGATTFEDLPEAVADRIRQAFENVSAFSVRDENTRQFVSRLTDTPAEEYFDPVVVGDFDQEIQNAALPQNLPERYCVVYSYYNRICRQEEIRAIRRFCREHRLKIIAVGAPQMWIRNYLVLEPFRMLKVFQHADFVITDTFHGTIFSAKYVKRFATVTRPSNENKLRDLIAKLGLEKHAVCSFEQLEEAYAVQNDTDRIRKLSEEERTRSMRYLSESISLSREARS